MVPISAIEAELLANPDIVAIIDDRIFPYDPDRFNDGRMVSGDGGDVEPSLSIDDQGAISAIGGPSGAYQSYVAIWAYGPKTPEGREKVQTLMRLIVADLHGWQDPVSRAILMWGNTLGGQPANLRDAVTNYQRFGVNGVHPGIRT